MLSIKPLGRTGSHVSVIVGILSLCAVFLLGGASAAQAQLSGTTFSAGPQFPGLVSVGDQDEPAALRLQNTSTGSFADDRFAITFITLVPNCGAGAPVTPPGGIPPVASDCPVGSRDPGVFLPSATGRGAGVGSNCLDRDFDFNLVDPAQGKYSVTPTDGQPVILGPADGSGPLSNTCFINYTFDVARLPLADSDPGPGLQTDQIGGLFATDIEPGISQTGTGTGTSQVTVLQATISTQVSGAALAVGQPFTDEARVGFTPGTPQPTGTVTFNLYASVAACNAGTPVLTSSTSALSAASPGTTPRIATSDPYTPVAPGTYIFVATYNGDANYNSVSGTCADGNETVVVTKATPAITTQVSAPARVVGQPFTDEARVSFTGGPGPTGTVTFNLYATLAACNAGTPVLTTSTNALGGGVSPRIATSDPYTPVAPGTYIFVATYNGDANYNSVSGTCADGNETVVVTKATPGITTQVSAPARVVGQPFTDEARVSFTGGPGPTGTVTFNLYATLAACNAGTPVLTTSTNALGGGVSPRIATSDPYTPVAPGTYIFVATYNGDANYNSVSGTCADGNETVVVTKATPGITTQVSAPARVVGQPFTDEARVSFTGGPGPTGTVTFNLYATLAACNAGTPVLTTSTNALGGGVSPRIATSDPYTPVAPGTYIFVATYNGDANYNSVSGTCADGNETVVVTKATPGITTQVSAPARVVGQPFTDEARVSFTGGPGPTGTVTFELYATLAACNAGTPVLTTSTNALGGGVSPRIATSDPYTPVAPGTYIFVATYNGDANYNSVSGTCADGNETVVVTKATPGITTQVSAPARVVGQPFTDEARVSFTGGPGPTGTVTFELYASLAACNAGTPVLTTSTNALGGGVSPRIATSDPYTPVAPGTYIFVATYNGDANYNSVSGTCADDNERVVVAPQTPGITTQVSAPARVVGQPFTDEARVTFTGGPGPTGTVTFKLYATLAACNAGTPVLATSTNPLGGGASPRIATSDPYTPVAPGTYRFVATYNGDANYGSVSGTCADDNETVVVTKATPGITTQVSAPARVVGQPFTDEARVTFTGGPGPTGTVTFKLYATLAACNAGTPVLATSTNPLGGGASPRIATSDPYTPVAPGTYRFVATYNGDANYDSVSGTCADDNETVVVTKATPGVTTQVSAPARVVGQPFTDEARVTFTGGPGRTGTVTFKLYATLAACNAGTPVLTTSTNTLGGGASPRIATSDSYTPLSPGTYVFVATYNGDANYDSVSGTCADDNERVVVTPQTPGITTQVSAPARVVGQPFTDEARVTFTGGPGPTGTVTFKLYASLAACNAGTPVLATSTNPLGGGASPRIATSDSYTPLSPGTYRFVATYNGDANYDSVSGTCADDNERVVVTPQTPAITTQVSAPVRAVGQPFTDEARVSFTGGPGPTGTVTFKLYASLAACNAGTPVLATSTNTLGGGASPRIATSDSYTPLLPGTYVFVATYNGDGNYGSVSGACADDNERVVVTPQTPAITTQVSAPARVVGQSFTDEARVSFTGGPGPTGTVTFKLYASLAACNAGTPVLATSTNTLGGGASPRIATSDSYTPLSPGTYVFVATYNGDANYGSVSGACADDNERVVVSPGPQIGVVKTVTPASQLLPSGDFTFTVVVNNPGPEAIDITGLTDSVYGNIGQSASGTGPPPRNAQFRSSTCPTVVVGIRLQPGQSSPPCTFIGTFSSTSTSTVTETDIVTARGIGVTSRIPVQATDDAIVQLTPRQPQIGVIKDASPDSQPVPGGAFTFTVRVTNPGNVPIVINSLTDDIYGNIANTSGTGPNGSTFTDSTCGALIGTTLQPGATSAPCTFSGNFTNETPAAQTDVVTVVGHDVLFPNGPPVSAHDDARVELTPLPTTPPPPPPPVVVPPPPPPPPPPAEVLPEVTTPKGTATISGKTGCYGTPFNVVVAGRQIERVIYSVDGKIVKTLMRPNSGIRFKLPIIPSRFKTGTHRVLARVIYTEASNTKNRSLRVVFSRCAKKASSPAFTG